MRHAAAYIETIASGTTFKEVSGRVAGTIPVAYPGIEDQRRIVAKLDQITARIDEAKARLDTIPGILKRLRMSVLAASLPPEGAEEYAIGDLLVEPLANGRSVPDAENGFPVLRLTAVKTGAIDLAERKIGKWTRTEAKRFLVKRGDFFVARGNGSLRLVGRGALLDTEPDAVAYPDTLIRVRVNTSKLVGKYLRLVWDTAIVRSQLEAMARTTAGIWKISQPDVAAVRIPLPSVAEQAEIVRRVEALFKQADAIEARYKKARAFVEKLTPAVLAKAFRGELA